MRRLTFCWSKLCMGALTWEVYPERRLTILRLVGDLEGWALRARLEVFWRAYPESIANHCLVDMRAYTGDLHYDDLSAIAVQWRAIAQQRDAGCGTAIVTHDRFAAFLMRAVALLFHTRRFALFTEPCDAIRWLGTMS
jgi:hypothetical protein